MAGTLPFELSAERVGKRHLIQVAKITECHLDAVLAPGFSGEGKTCSQVLMSSLFKLLPLRDRVSIGI